MKIVVASSEFSQFTPKQLARLQDRARAHRIVVTQIADRERHLREVESADVLFGLIIPSAIERASKLRWAHSIGTAVEDLAEPLRSRAILLTGDRGHRSYLAEHAFALLLALTRGIATAIRNPRPDLRHAIRERQWELTDRTMAIIGYGGAGQAVARRARGFEMAGVVAMDPEPIADTSQLDRLYRPDELDQCLGIADVVTICAPITPATRHLFDRRRFGAMKRGSILINIGRGEIVEESALLDALDGGYLFGAGLDVAPQDPLPAEHRLWSMPNVVVTPHVAGGSPRRLDWAVDNFCANLARYENGEPLQGVINFAKGY